MGAESSIFWILSIPCFISDMMNSARLTGAVRAPRGAAD